MNPILRPLSVARAAVVLLSAIGFLLPGSTGCQKSDSVGETSLDGLPPKGSGLRLIVVEDPAMAAAIRQLKAEWSGQSGWDLDIQELRSSELDPEKGLEADAMIVPSSHLGTLAEGGFLSPLPGELARSSQADWSDIFDLVRSKEAVWDSKAMAVPFGSPVLTCYYRADLFERLNLKPPATWKDYLRLTEILSDRAQLGEAAPPPNQPWRGTMEPLASGWASATLLARAAAYASHRGNYSTLFNIETMEPLIDGPPFIRALEELLAAAGPEGGDLLSQDPAALRKAFLEGHCGMTLAWPTAATDTGANHDENRRIGIGFAEMPGSQDVYNVSDRAWETRRKGESPHVSLLGAAGRLGVVLRTSQWPDASFQLLLWLSDPQWSKQVSAASPATTLFRRSHLKDAGKWVDEAVPLEDAISYAGRVEQALSRQQSLSMLRIPGWAEYLSALDAAVHKAVAGDVPAPEALQDAAGQWREITERLGVEKQRKAYGSSLGLN